MRPTFISLRFAVAIIISGRRRYRNYFNWSYFTIGSKRPRKGLSSGQGRAGNNLTTFFGK